MKDAVDEVVVFAGGYKRSFRALDAGLDAVMSHRASREADSLERCPRVLSSKRTPEGGGDGLGADRRAEGGEDDDAPPSLREERGGLGGLGDVLPVLKSK